jgi:hypothetical protein
VLACAVTAKGLRVVSSSHDRALKVWDLKSGRAIATLDEHAVLANACVMTADGRRVILATDDRALKVWDLESGRAAAVLEGHADWVKACAVTEDGRRVITASGDGTLRIWDLEGGRAIATLEGHADGVNACAVTADDRRVISASDDRTLKIWDLEDGRAIATLEGHAGGVNACVVTADGRRVISASDDRTLKIWDLESGDAIATLEGHAGPVNACAVTADGRRAVSASADRTLKVWDLQTRACLLTHRGDGSYEAVAATATGIAAGDASGAVWMLDWPPGEAPLPLMESPVAMEPLPLMAPGSSPSLAPSKRVDESPPRRILHLSDLHFSTVDQAAVWYAQLAADLRELRVDRLDALVVSGDLVDRADPAEYEAARRFLEQLMAGTSLSPRQVALVPGNHDASWPLAEKAYQLHRRKQYAGPLVPGRYVEHAGGIVEVRDEAAYRERLRPFAELYRAVKGAPYPLAFEEQGIVDDLADLGLCVLGLNSAWETDHHFRERASIHPEALANALLRLGPPAAGQLRIAVFHHPIHGGEDSRIRDAAFLQQLAVHGFQLALHGHVHRADSELYRHDRAEDGRRIEIVAAGTFGAATRAWVPGYPLQYNLLLVGPDRITVETRCRHEVNGAWSPDARWRQGPGQDPLPRYFIER